MAQNYRFNHPIGTQAKHIIGRKKPDDDFSKTGSGTTQTQTGKRRRANSPNACAIPTSSFSPDSLPLHSICTPTQNATFPSAFPMFVPSLSWQNNHF